MTDDFEYSTDVVPGKNADKIYDLLVKLTSLFYNIGLFKSNTFGPESVKNSLFKYATYLEDGKKIPALIRIHMDTQLVFEASVAFDILRRYNLLKYFHLKLGKSTHIKDSPFYTLLITLKYEYILKANEIETIIKLKI